MRRAKTFTPPRPTSAFNVVSEFIASAMSFDVRSNTAESSGLFDANHCSNDAYEVGNKILNAKSSSSAHSVPVLSACAMGA